MNTQSNQLEQPDQPFELLTYYLKQYEQKRKTVAVTSRTHNEFFAFKVADKNLLVEMQYVTEIVKSMPQITPLPFSPKWLLGIAGLRGDVFSVIDLKSLFNITDAKYTKHSSFLVLGYRAHGYILKIDEIIGIRDCELSQLDTQQPFFSGKGNINGEDYFMLNLEEVIGEAAFQQDAR